MQVVEKSLLEEFGNSKQRVEKALSDLKAGKGLLLVDDENRENEGDLIFSAEYLTKEQVAMMIREGSGIICLCLPEEKLKELKLPQMVAENESQNQTAFTVSIEAKHGVSTGVSAKDRLTTIQTAVKEGAKAEDLARPGHVFPLRAKKGGVLERRGHTEGSVDLMKLAGLKAAGVLCELTNADGTMARLKEVVDFAKEHNMLVLSIEDIVQYKANHV